MPNDLENKARHFPGCTIKYFWVDPYLTSHQTQVSTVDGNRITLSSTIFFAFSGGQESDCGTISGIPVLNAEKADMEIQYTLPENHNLHPGDTVKIDIDWTRRYKLMRLHFAAELVLLTVYNTFPGIEKIGAHIGPEKARVDFRWPENLTPVVEEISGIVNRIIKSDVGIRSEFEDEEAERRYWEIEGLARVPCGGTHLKRTGEIGPVFLKRENIGRSKERLEIRTGL